MAYNNLSITGLPEEDTQTKSNIKGNANAGQNPNNATNSNAIANKPNNTNNVSSVSNANNIKSKESETKNSKVESKKELDSKDIEILTKEQQDEITQEANLNTELQKLYNQWRKFQSDKDKYNKRMEVKISVLGKRIKELKKILNLS